MAGHSSSNSGGKSSGAMIVLALIGLALLIVVSPLAILAGGLWGAHKLRRRSQTTWAVVVAIASVMASIGAGIGVYAMLTHADKQPTPAAASVGGTSNGAQNDTPTNGPSASDSSPVINDSDALEMVRDWLRSVAVCDDGLGGPACTEVTAAGPSLFSFYVDVSSGLSPVEVCSALLRVAGDDVVVHQNGVRAAEGDPGDGNLTCHSA